MSGVGRAGVVTGGHPRPATSLPAAVTVDNNWSSGRSTGWPPPTTAVDDAGVDLLDGEARGDLDGGLLDRVELVVEHDDLGAVAGQHRLQEGRPGR